MTLNEYVVDFVFEGYTADETRIVRAESDKHAVEIAKKKVDPELLEKILEIYVNQQTHE